MEVEKATPSVAISKALLFWLITSYRQELLRHRILALFTPFNSALPPKTTLPANTLLLTTNAIFSSDQKYQYSWSVTTFSFYHGSG